MMKLQDCFGMDQDCFSGSLAVRAARNYPRKPGVLLELQWGCWAKALQQRLPTHLPPSAAGSPRLPHLQLDQQQQQQQQGQEQQQLQQVSQQQHHHLRLPPLLQSQQPS